MYIRTGLEITHNKEFQIINPRSFSIFYGILIKNLLLITTLYTETSRFPYDSIISCIKR